jgi:hypothetical protein
MLTGGCLCGGVRFEISEPLLDSGWCHCTRCRRRTGTPASVNASVAPAAFRLVAGADLVTEFAPPDGAVKAFCSVCGGHLYSRGSDGWSQVGVRLGAIDGDPGIRPAYRQFVADAAVWDPIPDDGLPQHAAHRSAG